MFTDPVRIVVPGRLAERLAADCTLEMDGHVWTAGNLAAARGALREQGVAVVDALCRQVGRGNKGQGWAVVALPARLGDEQLQQVAAGVLAALGSPFNSINQDGRLWIGGESSPQRDGASFGGHGPQRLHIDAPNVQRVPDYTCLLVLRPDPAGGGASLIGELPAALGDLTDADRQELRSPVFHEGRADGLLGVGAPRLPFPVLEDSSDGRWIRWAGKLLDDPRNSRHASVLRRFAAALDEHSRAVVLSRGQLLIADQQRIAHGRTALGPTGDGAPRLLLQAKVRHTADAPAQQPAEAATGVRHG